MYAITDKGWRTIAADEPLAAGETLADEIPDSLVRAVHGEGLRARRNALLRESDWTQAGDSPLAPAAKQAWAAYRAALRALPALPGFPDVEWPRPPVLADGTADQGRAMNLAPPA